MAKMIKRKCAFCPDDEPSAIMYIAEERNLAVHQECLLFSSGFVESEEQNPEDLNKRFDVASVVDEIKRGRKLMCSWCHQRGATIGCEIKSCRRTYHYVCAVCDDASTEIDETRGLYRLFCRNHIPAKRSSVYDENNETAMPLVLTESSSTTTTMNGETIGEENMEVISDQTKERIEFLKKCKQAGLLNEIFEEMLNIIRLTQEKLMDDNTSEAEYEKTVISLFDCGLFENILRAAHSGTEEKIQKLMNNRKGLDAQIEFLRVVKETVFPVSEDRDNTLSSISE
ncbi:PREDICTED: PHD finger protein 11 [Thamnophis sirtalis]|uniref:PHD finger protein 11 n=1 Tax=Thamnophis sirtalis TaxID=35019 RepID=A0A6I9X5T6_9SAUR|nr:PREDICTED: PHD finger protein 11 [Thamnophis sirtalis]